MPTRRESFTDVPPKKSDFVKAFALINATQLAATKLPYSVSFHIAVGLARAYQGIQHLASSYDLDRSFRERAEEKKKPKDKK